MLGVATWRYVVEMQHHDVTLKNSDQIWIGDVEKTYAAENRGGQLKCGAIGMVQCSWAVETHRIDKILSDKIQSIK